MTRTTEGPDKPARTDALPLTGRTALVTGFSRRDGIGVTLASALLDPGTTDLGEDRVRALLAPTPSGRFGVPAAPAAPISRLASNQGPPGGGPGHHQ